MKRMNFWKACVIAIAAMGVAIPRHIALAEPSKVVSAHRTGDVSLSESGTLTGQLLDSEQQPVAGAKVSLMRAGHEVASAETDDQGIFQVEKLRGGVYLVKGEQTARTFRVWTADAAPPAAEETAILTVADETEIVRGQSQCDPCDPAYGGAWGGTSGLSGGGMLLGAAAIAGIVVGTIGLVQAEEAQDEIDALKRRLATP